MKKRFNVDRFLMVVLAILMIILPVSIASAMTNLDDGIQLQKSEWIDDARLKTKSQEVSLKNVSDGVYYTPLIKVVLETISDPEVTVANADGITPDGNPYFLYSPPGHIGPGLRTENRAWVFAYSESKINFGHPLDYTTRVWGCTDGDADGYFLEADCGTTPDCDDNDSHNNPGMEEICDDQDNDCDNLVDEGVKKTFFGDKDGDFYINPEDSIQACSWPEGYVLDGPTDCNDEDANWWLPDQNGNCVFKGNVDCEYPYINECHPAIHNVKSALFSLEENHVDVNGDSFKWMEGAPRPGKHAPDPSSKRHLQSIQYFGDSTDHHLVITMSDETEDDNALVGLVQTVDFGSNMKNCGEDCDYISAFRILNADPEVAMYDHAGGTQIIGKYLFVALEDMKEPHSLPKTGVWSVDPHATYPQLPINFEYTIDLDMRDYHHTAVAVTKLADGTYLMAACVIEACKAIQFYKSRETSLVSNPDFRKIDTFIEVETTHSEFGEHGWSDCGVQNANLVVDSGGGIYMVMLGMRKDQIAKCDTDSCGWGNADSYLFVYEVTMKPGNEIDLEFIMDVPIHNGNNCGLETVVGAQKDNFEAGAGLWIGPLGNDDIAVLDTEHYDSCQGKSIWGVTANWW